MVFDNRTSKLSKLQIMESTIDLIKEKITSTGSAISDVQNVNNIERVVSLVAGAVATYYGLQKKDTLLGKGLTFVGGLLITRGTTGYCPMNQALDRKL
jgi:uncharacterized protein (UPF0305 family)